MKKILIIKPKIIEDGIITHYIYPQNYNAQHAKHICYNFSNEKSLKGGHLAEGMVIYKADKKEFEALLQEGNVEEINYDKAKIKGKQWKPKQIINGQEKKEFDIKDWIKNKDEIK